MSDSEKEFYQSDDEEISDIEEEIAEGEEEGEDVDDAQEEGGEEKDEDADDEDADDEDADDEEEDDDDEEEDGKKTKSKKKNNPGQGANNDDDEEEDTTGESFMFKVDDMDTIYRKAEIQYDAHGKIEDPNHKTTPFMTKYEFTKIISTRMKMITNGSRVFVNINAGDSIRDIVINELKEKKIPFIIRRPIPNGTFEYWRVKDLIPYEA